MAADQLVITDEFDSSVTYLNTPTYGLPPRRAVAALDAALDDWKHGVAHPPDYDRAVSACRAAFAGLVGVEVGDVAVGSQVSVFAGLVAASVPDGAEVVVAEGEFTSVTFPFLVQSGRGVRVREVPLEDLPGSIDGDTALVAVAAVQSADGRVVDLDALADAADAVGAKVLLDTTQAVGWLPVEAGRFAYTVCGGYKWLLAMRGTCFATIRPEERDRLVPQAAGWYAGEEPWQSIYGGPLRLAHDARRYDVSPAWYSWISAAPAIELLADIGTARLHRHAVGLAGDFRAAVGLPSGHSAIVSLDVAAGTNERLARESVVASVRAGRLRLGFHLYNTSADVDRVADLVADRLVAS